MWTFSHKHIKYNASNDTARRFRPTPQSKKTTQMYIRAERKATGRRPKVGNAIYSKLRISCRDTACRVRSQSTSNLCKIAIKQVGLRYNHHQYKNTLKGLYFKA